MCFFKSNNNSAALEVEVKRLKEEIGDLEEEKNNLIEKIDDQANQIINLQDQVSNNSGFKKGDIDFTYTRLNGTVQKIMIDSEEKLTSNFKVKEFLSGDGSRTLILNEKIVVILQLLRDYYNKPITVTSGYRTKAHNDSVGGSSNSQHLYGKAADFLIGGVNVATINNYIKNTWQLLGVHGLETSVNTHVHIDIRDSDKLIEF
jgi:uncharacterized protein YcbK (DUF882 family)